jgi:predicted unusual protein kinase regulating ubiquinone biosynthesis (AarF/ABC1/UbiB family)
MRGDGRLVVVDFGASLPMPRGWPARLGDLLRAGRDGDAAALLEIAVRAGIVRPGDMSAAALLGLLDPVLEPLREDTFAFTRSWLRAQTVRLSDPRSAASRAQRKLRVPVRYLLVQRVAAGTTGVLCQLGATVPVRAEVARSIPALGP